MSEIRDRIQHDLDTAPERLDAQLERDVARVLGATARPQRVRVFVREPLLHILAQTLDGVPGVSVERDRRRGKERRQVRLMREKNMRKDQRRGAVITGFHGIVTLG